MILDKKGVTRIVILTKNYAIKIPNFLYQHNHFLQGCYANWSERMLYKMWKDYTDEPNLRELIAPSYFCSWFGLIQIQKRVALLNRDLTKGEKKKFKIVASTDLKKENFGILDGRIVCVDYP